MNANWQCLQDMHGHADEPGRLRAMPVFALLEYDGAAYDSYLELDRATFFLTQTVARGMVEQGRGGAMVNISSMWVMAGRN